MHESDACDELARRLEARAPELTEQWAAAVRERLRLDVSPYPDPQDPQIVRGIARSIGARDRGSAHPDELVDRARDWAEIAHARSIPPEQILDAYLTLDGLLWDATDRIVRSDRALDRDRSGALVCARRLHEAVTFVVRVTANEQLRLYRDRIERDTERLRGFNRMVGHELKGSLSTVLSAAEMLSRPELAQVEDTREQAVEMIRRNSRSMADLLDDLLELTIVERADGTVLEVVDLRAEVERVFERLEPEAHERGVELRAADQMPRVRTDHRALALVLGNLVKNGIRYSDPDEVERWVRVDARRTDEEQGMVEIRVDDNGIGIPERARPRVFERFYRAATDVPGTGLGLGLVREEVERWRGRVWFESEEGVGTSFRFTIQAAE